MDTINSQASIIPKVDNNRKLIFLIAIHIIVILGIFAFLFTNFKRIFKSIPAKQEPAVTNIIYQLPKKNILVYTKCYGKPGDNCFLYVGTLFDAEPEIRIFPNSNKGIPISIAGVVDRKVVITKHGQENILGIVDLNTGKETDFYKYSSTYLDSKHKPTEQLISQYADEQSKKIFFTTETGMGVNPKLYQYDIESDSLTVIAKALIPTPQGYSDTFSILSGSNGKLFLTVLPRGGSIDYQWFKTFDVKSKKFEDVKEPKDNAIFDPTGQHIAYLKTLNKTKESWDTQLIVEDVDGSNQKIIFTAKDVRPGLPRYPNIDNNGFNTYGDTLTFTVNTDSQHSKSYISHLSVRKNDPDIKGGITLLPPDNKDVYKDLIEFIPPATAYQWIKFYETDTPIGDYPVEALLYKENDQNAFVNMRHVEWSLGSATDQGFSNNVKKLPILINAQQVFVIPK